MRQTSFVEGSFKKFHKRTRKAEFLAQMEVIIPWKELTAVIAPHYPKPRGAGRRPVGVERMLRIYFMQHWFNLSDPGAEEALYDDGGTAPVCRDRLGAGTGPGRYDDLQVSPLDGAAKPRGYAVSPGESLFGGKGLAVSRRTIEDATLIDAPSSTKNRQKRRDPEMGPTKKGNQWYCGIKAHIGVDSRTKLIHSVAVTAATAHTPR